MSALAERLSQLFTDPNPILVKELRATFRTHLFVRFLYISTAIVALLVLAIGASIASSEVPPATVGQVVFQLFLGAGLFLICAVAPGYASAALTSEYEQSTWESLELSGMSAARIVLGKLAATYASFALVLIAFTPVIGIAFLFGGVSPGQVAVGVLSLLVALAPAIAYGVAVGARLRSTRLAIVLSTPSFFLIALVGLAIMIALGEEARSAWGVAMEGPFFYTEAFVTRFDRLETWLFLVALPIYAFGMPTWFLLATAVAGLRPAAEDRARPLKVWALVLSVTAVPIALACVAAQPTSHSAGETALVAVILGALVVLLYGLLFTNEPPLPARAWEIRRASLPPWRRAFGVLGAGAAGTMRFSVLLSLLTVLSLAAATIVGRHAMGFADSHVDLSIVVLSIGAAVVAVFSATCGALLRVVLGHGLAARVVTVSALLASALLPFLAALLIDVDWLGDLDRRAPLVLAFSPIHPLVLALQVVDGHGELWQLVVPVGLYGGLALLFGIMVEVRVAQARKSAAVRRARFEVKEEPAP